MCLFIQSFYIVLYVHILVCLSGMLAPAKLVMRYVFVYVVFLCGFIHTYTIRTYISAMVAPAKLVMR